MSIRQQTEREEQRYCQACHSHVQMLIVATRRVIELSCPDCKAVYLLPKYASGAKNSALD